MSATSQGGVVAEPVKEPFQVGTDRVMAKRSE
jgi:hypothetical protein